jgi:flagellin-like hook-associated protein FlgL
MRTQIRGLSQGGRNINDGISLTNTAEGYLNEITAITQRIRELSVQASNGTYACEDRAAIQLEIDQLVQEIDDITERAEFNGIKLFRGAVGKIDYAEPEFATIGPACPAIIIGSPFGVDSDTGDSEIVRIDGGTQASQSTNVTGETGFHLSELGTNFPREGLFVIRVGIPGGMLPADLPAIVPPRDVVLDFSVLNADGDFTLDDFETFFIGTPTGATRTDFNGNTMPVYAGGAFSDLINADELRFDINRTTGAINVRTIGLGGARAQVGVGVTNMSASDWVVYNDIHGTSYTTANVKYANSALLGATAQSNIGNNANALPAGFNLDTWLTNPNSLAFGATFDVGDGVNRPVRVAQITPANESFQPALSARALELLRTNYMDCPAFWNSLVASQGSTTFTLTMQERIANPNFPGLIRSAVTGDPIVPNRQEPEFLFPGHSATEATNTPWLPTIGDTRYAGYPVENPAPFNTSSYSQSISQLNANGATTLRNADTIFNNDRPTSFFASAGIGSVPRESFQVDRQGNVLFNWGTSALLPSTTPPRSNGSGSGTSSYPSPNYRILVGTAPNGSSYYAPVPAGTAAATITSGLRTSVTGFVMSTPIYPARMSQTGTLEIRISI